MDRFAASRHAMAFSAASSSTRQQVTAHQARILDQLPAYATEQQRNTVKLHNFGALDVLDVELPVFEGSTQESAQAVAFIRSRGWFRIRTSKVAVLTKHGPHGVEYGNLYFNPRGGCVNSVFAAMQDEMAGRPSNVCHRDGKRVIAMAMRQSEKQTVLPYVPPPPPPPQVCAQPAALAAGAAPLAMPLPMPFPTPIPALAPAAAAAAAAALEPACFPPPPPFGFMLAPGVSAAAAPFLLPPPFGMILAADMPSAAAAAAGVATNFTTSSATAAAAVAMAAVSSASSSAAATAAAAAASNSAVATGASSSNAAAATSAEAARGSVTSASQSVNAQVLWTHGHRKTTCVVCMDAKSSVLTMPCKHMVTCAACAHMLADRGIKHCTMCRATIEEYVVLATHEKKGKK